MHVLLSRTFTIRLLLLWVAALALNSVVSPVRAVVPEVLDSEVTAQSTSTTLSYISQLCPGDVVQGEVPLRGRPGLFNELNEFFVNGDASVFANADLYYFYGNENDEVRIVARSLTDQLDLAMALSVGFDLNQSAFWYVDQWPWESEVIWTGLWKGTGIYTIAVWDEMGVGGPLQDLPYELEITGTIPPCSQDIQVVIDIQPGNAANTININGNGVIPVAILGSVSFDVNQIDISSLQFAGLDVRVRGNGVPQCAVEDVNADAIGDLVCQFVDDATQWSPDNGTASLTGNLRSEFGGTAFHGSDVINIIQR